MKALIVLPEPPLPEGGASGRCALALLVGLREHGVDVRALAAREAWAARDEPPEDAGVHVVDVASEPPGLRSRVLSLTRPLTGLARSGFAGRVRDAARDADVVHLEEVSTTSLDHGMRKPSLAHLHYLVRLDRPPAAPWRREFRHALELARAEARAIRRHRFLLASSPLIAAELQRRSRHGTEVVLAPLSLEPARYPRAPLDGPPVAGIIGSAAWPPTADAIRRLATEVWPLVRGSVPQARLAIAGRGTDSLVARSAGVEALGQVPSASEFLRGLSLLLFPLERGSGMKVKVLEAIASGLPVITTPAGAEGIDGGDGVIVETSTTRLAGAAERLLLDETERQERGTAARMAFERRYTPRVATEPIADLYARMV
jgi:glycosyltransferase involved in cell wall biosynthesis